ncbi:MAG TPA: hypothetical protein VNF00_01375 [Candidatus Acidoferrales bacterium]|nr:hypothetical protein [Candidatus Acidoferrales bacterium]
MDAFLGERDLLLVRKGLEKLANGGFDERTAKFIKEQQAFASNVRLGQRQRLESRADAKHYLKSICPESLGQWLEEETYGSAGPASLKVHILTRFPEATEMEAMEYASALLASSGCRTARAMVRAGSYYIWRCTYRGSVPSDLFDDMYHVLNSVYCDVYATEEDGQAGYARLLLTASTIVAIYEGEPPIDQWLEGLARQ